MSGTDIKDILGRPTAHQLREAGSFRKELLSLTGGVPQLQIAKAKYKQLPKFSRKSSKWVWKKFDNPARKDGLQLSHWIQDNDNGEYNFAKYHQTKDFLIKYTDEEYSNAIESEASSSNLKNSGWSKEETDYLFDLVDKYNLRWFVIADSFDFTKDEITEDEPIEELGNFNSDTKNKRELDDLKARYYSVCKDILILRYPNPDSEQAKMISVYDFNKEFELQRKKNLERLYQRTAEQIKEEEELFLELKRREAREDRINKDRLALSQLLKDSETKGIPSYIAGAYLPSELKGLTIEQQQELIARQTQLHEAQIQALQAVSSQLLNNPSTQIPIIASDQSSDSITSPNRKTHIKRKSINEDPTTANAKRRKSLKEENTSGSRPSTGEQPKEKFPVGASLRSLRIAQPKVTLIPKCMQMLLELGVPQRPVMATGDICSKYSELQMELQSLLELKKQIDRLEFQTNKIKKVASEK